MSRTDCIREIVRASERYYRAFALTAHVEHQRDSLEWISPAAGYQGPSLVFGVNLTRPAALQVECLLPALREKRLPSLWVLHPLCSPKQLGRILLEKGFACLSTAEQPEYGMHLSLIGQSILVSAEGGITVMPVEDPDTFCIWMQIANTALHGWDLLTPGEYGLWLKQPSFRFYLGFADGIPAATAAVFCHKDTASLEFVSTLKAYRHRGASYALCSRALLDLQTQGFRSVTLRARFASHRLYKHLGFRPCYAQKLYRFHTT